VGDGLVNHRPPFATSHSAVSLLDWVMYFPCAFGRPYCSRRYCCYHHSRQLLPRCRNSPDSLGRLSDYNSSASIRSIPPQHSHPPTFGVDRPDPDCAVRHPHLLPSGCMRCGLAPAVLLHQDMGPVFASTGAPSRSLIPRPQRTSHPCPESVTNPPGHQSIGSHRVPHTKSAAARGIYFGVDDTHAASR